MTKEHKENIIRLLGSENGAIQLYGIELANTFLLSRIDIINGLMPKNKDDFRSFSIDWGGLSLYLRDVSQDLGVKERQESIYGKVDFCCVVWIAVVGIGEHSSVSRAVYYYEQLDFLLFGEIGRLLDMLRKDDLYLEKKQDGILVIGRYRGKKVEFLKDVEKSEWCMKIEDSSVFPTVKKAKDIAIENGGNVLFAVLGLNGCWKLTEMFY
jgi:hypothetical protein